MPDITWGSEYEFVAGAVAGFRKICPVSSTKFAVAWLEADGADQLGKVRIGTVSDSAVTFDGIVTFCTKLNIGSGGEPYFDICQLADDVVGIVYKAEWTGSGGSSGLYARVGIVSGTTITLGSATLISGSDVYGQVSCCSNGSSTIVAIHSSGTYPNDIGRCTVCTREGNVVTAGGAVNVADSIRIVNTDCVSLYSGGAGPVTGEVLVTYRNGSGGKPKAVVASIWTDLPLCGAVNTLDNFGNGAGRCDVLGATKAVMIVTVPSPAVDAHGEGAILDISSNVVTEGAVVQLTPSGASILGWSVCKLPGSYIAFLYERVGYGLKSRYCSYSGSTITLGDSETIESGNNRGTDSCLVGSKLVITYYDAVAGGPYPDYVRVGILANVLPTVTTDTPLDMSCTSSIPRGTLDDDGGGTCDCGFEWGETDAYGNTTITYEKTTGQAFSHILTELDATKEYHYRAFATNTIGTGYGADETIPIKIPIVTASASGETTHTVDLAGEVTTSTRTIDERGFDWGLTDSYGDSWTESDSYGEDAFTHALTGLIGDTTYHFRAKAHNECGWGYSADDTFTTGAEVYPTEALTRVTSLVHRWMPGSYTLTIGLGEVTSEFILPDITYVPMAGPIVPPVPPVPPVCLEGQYRCFGTDLFVCFEGRWVLALKDAPQCKTGECIEGSYRCFGKDLYVCFEGRWILSLKNAPECKGK